MPRLHKIALIVSIIVLAMIVSPFIYVEVNKNVYENRVNHYLLEEKGYDKEEIASVEGVIGLKMPPFYTTVIFENEPYVEYTYFAHNEVIQFDYKITDEEHKGINEEELKNLDKQL
ncbi:DUF3139 domain-containing protein [Thalassobacillus sp. CUG 92003]|uniref:DUF3139 domain-containing protein n=1 Tax=Thalassobacillus sp. CUG 92003 TaxID=2736641 RepID=UPI0015E772F5|nr:DUF3139 domain-containing protein [Thalassobacillus sp. CUG 92003]